MGWIFFLLSIYNINKLVRMALTIALNYTETHTETENNNRTIRKMRDVSDYFRFYCLPVTDLFIGFSFLYFSSYQMNRA